MKARLFKGTVKTAVLLGLIHHFGAHAIPSLRTDPLLNQESLLLPLKAIVNSKDIRLRALPSTENTRVVDVLPFGTPVTLVERKPDKISLSNHDGYWFRLVTPSNKEGWVFGKFLISEESGLLKEQLDKALGTLWHARPQLTNVLKKVRDSAYTDVSKNLEGVKPVALNYLGYHLLAEQHPNALPVLTEFMNPANKGLNQKDPNYTLTWEILSRLTPNQLMESSFDSYKKYWEEKGKKYTFPLSRSEVFALLLRVKQAEDRAYRKAP